MPSGAFDEGENSASRGIGVKVDVVTTSVVGAIGRFQPQQFCFQFPHFPVGRQQLIEKTVALLLHLVNHDVLGLVRNLQIPDFIFQFPDCDSLS